MRHNPIAPVMVCLLLLVTIALLVTAGCSDTLTGQQGQVSNAREAPSNNPAVITAPTGTAAEPVSRDTQESTPATGTSDGVIRLDPVSDRYDGQEYLITGTTTLPPGTGLLLQIMPDTGTPPNGTSREAIGGRAASTAWITEGNGTANRIRIQGNMKGHPRGKWVALVGEMNGSYADMQVGDHYAYAYFIQKPDPSSVSSADSAGHSPGNATGTCSLVPVEAPPGSAAEGFTYENTSVFTAVSAGTYSSRSAWRDAGITIDQAKASAIKAFSRASPDRAEVEYSNGSNYVRGWHFDLYKENQKIVMGTLDADTGDIRDYFIPAYLEGDQAGSRPTVTMDSARATAENEIRERNGGIPITLAESRLDPPSRMLSGMGDAGTYVFLFRRMIQGVPCNTDGFTISVDAESGKIVSYYKSWRTPENAVAGNPVPAISRNAAIAVIEREAAACYPDSADSFRIVSADLQWMDLYNADLYTPAPGAIPLAWYVRFDDKTIREREFPVPEEGSVDAQNGTLLSMYYAHNH